MFLRHTRPSRPAEEKMRTKDLYSSLFLIIGGLLSLCWVIPEFCPSGDGFGVPPATFPYALTGVIVSLAVLNFVKSLLLAKKKEAPSAEGPQGVKQIVLISSLLVLAIPGFMYLGFVITGVLFLIAFQLLLGQRSPLIIAIVSLVLPCLLYAVLWHGLRIPLP